MSYFHFKNCHGTCASHIKKYLETKHGKVANRAVETRLYNIVDNQYNRDNWDLVMDEGRDIYLDDGRSRTGREITHYHFVLSPDPEDGLSVDDVLELGEAFIKDAFGCDFETGKLGCVQVVMVAHTDSHNKERPVPHVHIVINNANMDTGKKLYFHNKENKWMYDHLQTLSNERGYHSFAVDRQERKKQREEYLKKNLERGAYVTKAERKIKKQGNYSWKFDIRNRVKVAIAISSTEEEFIRNLKKFEVTCTNRDDGDYLYTLDKNPTRWRSTGFKLGSAYVPSCISRNMSIPHTYNEEAVRKNLIRALEDAITVEAPIEVTIDQVANVLDVSRRYSCWNNKNLDSEIQILEKKIDETSNENRKTKLQKELSRLKQAKTDSENMRIFVGTKEEITIHGNNSNQNISSVQEWPVWKGSSDEEEGLSRGQIAAISRSKTKTINHQKVKSKIR